MLPQTPEKEKFPQEWKKKDALQKLCMMRYPLTMIMMRLLLLLLMMIKVIKMILLNLAYSALSYPSHCGLYSSSIEVKNNQIKVFVYLAQQRISGIHLKVPINPGVCVLTG